MFVKSVRKGLYEEGITHDIYGLVSLQLLVIFFRYVRIFDMI